MGRMDKTGKSTPSFSRRIFALKVRFRITSKSKFAIDRGGGGAGRLGLPLERRLVPQRFADGRAPRDASFPRRREPQTGRRRDARRFFGAYRPSGAGSESRNAGRNGGRFGGGLADRLRTLGEGGVSRRTRPRGNARARLRSSRFGRARRDGVSTICRQ